MKKQRSWWLVMVVLVALLLPMAASAESVFLPSVQNGTRDWFTVSDVVRWSAESGNVMPISCIAFRTDPEWLFRTCTVDQAQPLTLVWDDMAGKVVAK